MTFLLLVIVALRQFQLPNPLPLPSYVLPNPLPIQVVNDGISAAINVNVDSVQVSPSETETNNYVTDNLESRHRTISTVSSVEDFGPDPDIEQLAQLPTLQEDSTLANEPFHSVEINQAGNLAINETEGMSLRTRDVHGIAARQSSTPGGVVLNKDKPKVACPGCNRLFVGLKIHQNTCQEFKALARATTSVTTSLLDPEQDNDETLQEAYVSANNISS
jgi:hypothetical protein